MGLNPIQAAQDVQDLMITWRRTLHQFPELGNDLPETVTYVKSVLTELGIEHDSHYVNGNAIVGLIVGTKEGPNKDRVLALRADMDGLPIVEETGHEFASRNQNMHACGHDGHTAMLLGAAKILNENRDQFQGIVKLLFQPGEEYPGGAEPLIADGAMENPKVTRVMGFHEGKISGVVDSGQIAYKKGPMMASMDRFLIEITGKGYHGAYPENSNDPIAAAGQLITALQTIKSRNFKATEPIVVSITRVTGGFNQNIIPDKVELEGTVRTFSDQVRQDIHKRIDQITQGVCAGLGVKGVVTYDYKYPPVINDDQVTEEVVQSLSEIFEPGVLIDAGDPLMGGEDFAFYLKEAPGTFLFLGNPGLIEGEFHGHHHPKFDVDESYFYMATASFVKEALDYLG